MKIILSFLICSLLLFSGELKIEKGQNELYLSYFNRDTLVNPVLIWKEIAADGQVKEFSKELNGKVTIQRKPNNYYLFKISTKFFDDDNLGKLWEIKPNILSEGIFEQIASTYIQGREEIGRITNLDSAEFYYTKEIEKYPDNLSAHIAKASIQLDKRKIDFELYKDKINTIYSTVYDGMKKYSENDIKSFVRALKSINKNDIADKLEYNYISENPQSDYASEVFVSKMAEAESPEKFEEMTLKFLSFFPESNSIYQIIAAYISSELQSENYRQIISFMSQKNDLPFEIYAHFANRLIEYNTSGKEQDSLILFFYDKALDNAAKKENDFDSYSDSLDFTQKKLEILIAKGNYLSFLDSNVAAEKIFESILLEMRKRVNPSYFENYIDILVDEGKKKQILESAITSSNFSEKLFDTGEKLFGENWETKQAKWKQEARKTRMKYLKYSEIDGEQISGFLKETDETFIDLENLLGKPIMLSFFSTWCGPCEAMVPALEELEAITESADKDFYIASVSTWEKSESRWADIYGFLNTVEPRYKILIDETNLLPQKYGVTGLPTTIFVDKSGKIKFVEKGFSNTEEFVRNSLDRLKYLETN